MIIIDCRVFPRRKLFPRKLALYKIHNFHHTYTVSAAGQLQTTTWKKKRKRKRAFASTTRPRRWSVTRPRNWIPRLTPRFALYYKTITGAPVRCAKISSSVHRDTVSLRNISSRFISRPQRLNSIPGRIIYE